MNSIDFNEDFYKKKYLKYKAKYLKLTGGYDCFPIWRDVEVLDAITKQIHTGTNYNDLVVFYDTKLKKYKVVTIDKDHKFFNVFDLNEDNDRLIKSNFVNIPGNSGRSNVALITLNKFIMTDTEQNKLVELEMKPNNEQKAIKSYESLPFSKDKQVPKKFVKPRCVAFSANTLYVIDDGRIQTSNLTLNNVSEYRNDLFVGENIGLAVSALGRICVSINKKLYKIDMGKSMTEIKISCDKIKKDCIGVSRNIAFDGEDTICVADYDNKQVLLINFEDGIVTCNHIFESSPISIACANSKIFVCLKDENILKISNKSQLQKDI